MDHDHDHHKLIVNGGLRRGKSLDYGKMRKKNGGLTMGNEYEDLTTSQFSLAGMMGIGFGQSAAGMRQHG